MMFSQSLIPICVLFLLFVEQGKGIRSCSDESRILLFFFLAWTFLRLENITVTRGENVQLRCPLPRNYSLRENILQWKKLRSNDDDLIISINGKVPQTFSKSYRTDLTSSQSSLEVFHVQREDSTSYICQTFETQTILCQYNLIVLSK